MSTILLLTHGLIAVMSTFAFEALPAEPIARDNTSVSSVRIDVCIVRIPAENASSGGEAEAAHDAAHSTPPGDRSAPTSRPAAASEVVEVDPRGPDAAGAMQVELMRDSSLLQVGGRRYLVSQARLNPEESDDAADAEPVDVIAAPSILVNVGEKAAITIGRAVSYMRKLDNGDLRLVVEKDCIEGVEIEALVSGVKDGLIHLDSLSVRLSTVERREPIDGVPFDVGRPVVQTRQVSCSLSMAGGNTAVVPLPVGGAQRSTILLLISMHLDEGDRQAQ